MDKYYRDMGLDQAHPNNGQGGAPKRGYWDGDAPMTPYTPSPEALQNGPFSYRMPGADILGNNLQGQMPRQQQVPGQDQQSSMPPHAPNPWEMQNDIVQQMMASMAGPPGVQGGGAPSGPFNMHPGQGQQQPGMVNISPFAPRSQTAGQLINVGGRIWRAPTAEEEQARAFWT